MADSKDYDEKSPSRETVTVAMPSTESGQHRSITESAQFKVVTPKYKTSDKISSEVNLGGANISTGHTLSESNGEYRSEHAQEQFRMHIIDPKVNSNAYIPAHTASAVVKTRTVTEDFPSHHNKRSLLKLDPVEQRKFRSVESRPITTNAYLSESVNRHRAAEESKLKQYLKTKEGDANQPWDKPNWPGGAQKNEESLRELEQIRKSIDTLKCHQPSCYHA
ncbi:unnamed protein product [Bursaphelenchus okinawaensis]|uniref:Uncharacterized protein n=1 Tax=Bursaphelenchus okinawaensis TaxID=465554 RepID=A0A811KNB7_9BILA|nr:unnamed protein product [Bursaphelenchus okinawaensis]CAG9108255.1 unnamed protein product [Bursaphelenchus okinawaensis]